MKITNIRSWIVGVDRDDNPGAGEVRSPTKRSFVFVEVNTDEGITGWGEITTYPGPVANRAIAAFVNEIGDWLNGEDPREVPLLERKSLLREVIPEPSSRLLYLDHIEEQGVELFEQCCARDLEGIVAKPSESAYRTEGRQAIWIKVKNPDYTQAEGRRELFESPHRR